MLSKSKTFGAPVLVMFLLLSGNNISQTPTPKDTLAERVARASERVQRLEKKLIQSEKAVSDNEQTAEQIITALDSIKKKPPEILRETVIRRAPAKKHDCNCPVHNPYTDRPIIIQPATRIYGGELPLRRPTRAEVRKQVGPLGSINKFLKDWDAKYGKN